MPLSRGGRRRAAAARVLGAATPRTSPLARRCCGRAAAERGLRRALLVEARARPASRSSTSPGAAFFRHLELAGRARASSCRGRRPSAVGSRWAIDRRWGRRRTRVRRRPVHRAPARSRSRVAHEVPGAGVHAVELSTDALAWARQPRPPRARGRPAPRRRDARRARRARRPGRRGRLQPAVHPARRRGSRRPRGRATTTRRGAVRSGEDGLDDHPRPSSAPPPAAAPRRGASSSSTPTPRAARCPWLFARDGAWRDVADHPDLAGRPRATVAGAGVAQPVTRRRHGGAARRTTGARRTG